MTDEAKKIAGKRRQLAEAAVQVQSFQKGIGLYYPELEREVIGGLREEFDTRWSLVDSEKMRAQRNFEWFIDMGPYCPVAASFDRWLESWCQKRKWRLHVLLRNWALTLVLDGDEFLQTAAQQLRDVLPAEAALSLKRDGKNPLGLRARVSLPAPNLSPRTSKPTVSSPETQTEQLVAAMVSCIVDRYLTQDTMAAAIKGDTTWAWDFTQTASLCNSEMEADLCRIASRLGWMSDHRRGIISALETAIGRDGEAIQRGLEEQLKQIFTEEKVEVRYLPYVRGYNVIIRRQLEK